jgi:hypothetical protein
MTTIDRDQRLTGVVPWRVHVKGAVRHVDFLIDGEVVWRDSRRPFAFAGGRGWNTTQIGNGTHVLAVRATGRGRSAFQQLTVHVANRDFALTTSRLHPWQKVRGVVRIRANVRGAHTTGIGLYVDGKVKSRDRTAPFTLRWDSRIVRDGRHRITLAAVATDGRIVRRTLPLVVTNHPRPQRHPAPPQAPKRKPKPAPVHPIRVVSQTLADGSSVSGPVAWGAHTVGPVARVQFLVDGRVLATSTAEPWTTTWDTTSAVGPHTLIVRALGSDGKVGASASVSVTVTAAQAPPPPPSAPSP